MQFPTVPFGRSTQSLTNNTGFPAPTKFVRTAEVPEHQSNPFATFPILCRRFHSGEEQQLRVGDLLFVNIEKQGSVRSAAGPQAPLTVANLQQVNTLILRNEKDATDWCAANNWRFFGVFNNEGVRHGSDRLINAVVRGRTVRTQNVWPNSRVGDKVGFVLGKIDGSGNFAYDVLGTTLQTDLEVWMPAQFRRECFAGDISGELAERMLKAFKDNIANDTKLKTYQDTKHFLKSKGSSSADITQAVNAHAALKTAFENFLNVNQPIAGDGGDTDRSIWLPYNFTQACLKGAPEYKPGYHHNKVAVVGVISDMYNAASSRKAVTPHLMQYSGIEGSWKPMCELFVRVN
jgi:hypothetical protein